MDSAQENTNRVLAEKLFAAIRKERAEDVENYLCLGADPNYIVLNGHSPFHIAAGCQQSEHFIKLMLKYDGNPNVRNNEGLTPLHIATSWGKVDAMKLLALNGADANVRDYDGRDLKWYAEENGSPECVKFVESIGSNARFSCSSTPQSSKLSGSAIDDLLTSKENLNPNLHQRGIFGVRSPLNDACDDSWVVKKRGLLKRNRKNATSSINSPAIFPNCLEAKPDYLQEKSHLAPKTPGHVNALTENCVLYTLRADPDTSDKCIGTSLIQERSVVLERNDPDSTDKCIGTSVLRDNFFTNSNVFRDVTRTEEGTVEISGKSFVNQCEGESEEVVLSRRKDQDILHERENTCTTDNASSSADNGSNRDTKLNTDTQTPMLQDQHNGTVEKERQGLNAYLLHRSFDTSLSQTLPLSPAEGPQTVQNEADYQTAPNVDTPVLTGTRNALLSAKMPLPRSEMVEFFGESFVNAADMPENRVGDLSKDNKAQQGNLLSTVNFPTTKISTTPTKNSVASPKSTLRKYALPNALNLNALPIDKCPVGVSEVPNDGSVHPEGTSGTNTEKDSTQDKNVPMSHGEYIVNTGEIGNRHDHMSPQCSIAVEKRVSVSAKSPQPVHRSPYEENQSSVSLRRFAAMSLSEEQNSRSNLACTVSTERMHSTVLNQNTCDDPDLELKLWDISTITADSLSESKYRKQILGQTNSNSPPNEQSDAESDTHPGDSTSQTTIIYNWRSYWKGDAVPESVRDKRRRQKSQDKTGASPRTKSKPVLQCSVDLGSLSNSEIREKLRGFGVNPGPILACREIYLKKLEALITAQEQQGSNETCNATDVFVHNDAGEPKFSAELNRFVMGFPLPDSVIADDGIVRQQFEQPDPNLPWREGTTKSSFTYLLLDPRVTNELPIRAKFLSDAETFRAFTGAIFYIGKGKQCRPFHHFSEALQAKNKLSQKVRHILSVWEAGLGVVSLHIYQSTIACEAYTREAAMIDAVGLSHLTNCRRGEYYGDASRWDLSRKRNYGSYLLKKALEVLMVEGERQIKPVNLKTKKKKN